MAVTFDSPTSNRASIPSSPVAKKNDLPDRSPPAAIASTIEPEPERNTRSWSDECHRIRLMSPSPADISTSESAENEPTAGEDRYQFRLEVFGPASPTVSNARTISPDCGGIVPMVGIRLRRREVDC